MVDQMNFDPARSRKPKDASNDAVLADMSGPGEAPARVGVTSEHARPGAPGASLPRPVDHIPKFGTGRDGKSSPLPPSSPLYDIDLSPDAADEDGLSLATLRARATEALSYAEDALDRSREVAGQAREVASRYEEPLEKTSRELEIFTRQNPKFALALAFGAGVLVAKSLRRLT